MLLDPIALLALATAGIAAAQELAVLASDPLVYGPALEVAHLYYDQLPAGIVVARDGRRFSTYPPAFYTPNANGNYTLAVLNANNTETPYPNREINTPPGGYVNYTESPPTTANYADHFLSPQGIIIDARNRLWVLDNGRVASETEGLLTSLYGGPKLVAIDLSTNTVVRTILFPRDVAYPDSYLNDLRIDLRPSTTPSGQGVIYITDSSDEGRNGLITVDIGTGASWRHLEGHRTVRADQQHLPQWWNNLIYTIPRPGEPYTYQRTGADGLALSADGETLFWTATGSRRLYSIPTARLRDRGMNSEVLAQAAVMRRGEKGNSDGIDADSNNFVYVPNEEVNAINIYNPANATVTTFVRDPRIAYVDAPFVAGDGYLYFTCNQLWAAPSYYPGTDRTRKPYVLFRVPLPGNSTQVLLQ